MTMHRVVLLAALVASSGCSAQKPPAEGHPAPLASSKAPAPAMTGTFEGYVEATPQAPSPLTLTISSVEKDGGLVGTMLLGGEPIVPFATPGTLDQLVALFKDYRYQVVASSLDGNRVRFAVPVLAPYGPWCEKQKSYGRSCAPRTMRRVGDVCYGSDGPHGEQEVVDCELFEMCGISSPCECDDAGCRADLDLTMRFDMVFEGDGWTGSVLGFGEGPRTIRFRRVAGHARRN